MIIYSDSQLAACQLAKDYLARDPEMAKYLLEVREMERHFASFEVRNVRRTNNEEADRLAKAAAGQCPVEGNVFHEILKESSVAKLPVAANVLVLGEEDRRTLIRSCLEGKPLSEW